MILSCVATICFGIIDSTDTIVVEDLMTDEFKSQKYFSEIDIALIDDTLAGILSILIAFFIEQYLHIYTHLIKHPLLDAIGIIIGTIIVIVFSKYVVRKYYFKKTLEEKEHKSREIHSLK